MNLLGINWLLVNSFCIKPVSYTFSILKNVLARQYDEVEKKSSARESLATAHSQKQGHIWAKKDIRKGKEIGSISESNKQNQPSQFYRVKTFLLKACC